MMASPLPRRDRLALACVVAGAALVGFSAAPQMPVLLWNATASAPLGFYRMAPVAVPSVGDWVAYRPPAPLARWLSAGGYLPAHVPLLKKVAAVAGEEVCRDGDVLSIDETRVARILHQDSRGRPLRGWVGCRRLRDGELFLLNPAPRSLDGRYFGPVRTADLMGRAEPLWTWGAAP